MIISGVEFKDRPKMEWRLTSLFPHKVAKRDREQLFAIDYLVERTGSCRMTGQNGYQLSTNIKYFEKVETE